MVTKSQTVLATFFGKVGKLLRHELRETGTGPHRTWVVDFFYERGMASHDGETWTLNVA